jgi:outer membrane immunogenic protein
MRCTTVAVFAAGLAAIFPHIAGAADLSPITKAPPMAPVVHYTWTGCYLGIEGGGAWGHSDQIAGGPLGFGTVTGNGYDMSGGLIGGTGGCNYQFNQFVVGLEGDMSWTDKSGSTHESALFTTTTVVGTNEHWLATVRGRLGWTPVDRWLLYVTGGFAAADVEATIATTTIGSFSDTQTRTGWTAGVGVETAFWTNWSAKLEYLHVEFSSQQYFNPSPAVGVNIRSDVPLTNDIVRGGLNFHF